MKKFIVPAIVALTAMLSSCDGSGGREIEVSDEYEEAETYVAQMKMHIDSIYHNIPTLEQVKAMSCPESALSQIVNKRPMIFEPGEFNTTNSGSSWFRSDSNSNFMATEYYFNWNQIDPEHEWTLIDLASNIRKLESEKTICFFIEDTARFKLPQMDSVARSFEPGVGAGYAVIVDFVSGQIICATEIMATNSDEVNYKTYGADTASIHSNELLQFEPAFQLRVDLYENIKQEIYRKLAGAPVVQ